MQINIDSKTLDLMSKESKLSLLEELKRINSALNEKVFPNKILDDSDMQVSTLLSQGETTQAIVKRITSINNKIKQAEEKNITL